MFNKRMVKQVSKGLVLVASLFSISTFAAITGNPLPGMDGDNSFRNNIYERVEKETSEKYLKLDEKERQTVRVFFDFRCQFCQASHQFIEAWASSLPETYRVVYQPVISGDQTSTLLSAAYKFAEKEMAPPMYHKFVDNMYKHINQTRTVAQVGRLIREALVASTVNPNDFGRYLDDAETLKADLKADLDRQQAYGVEATPSIVVGATYLTSLDYAAGDPDKFITLLNIIVNMSIYEFE
jgi:protein-disulfide isomerase